MWIFVQDQGGLFSRNGVYITIHEYRRKQSNADIGHKDHLQATLQAGFDKHIDPTIQHSLGIAGLYIRSQVFNP